MTATGWGSPVDTAKLSTTNSGVSRPTTDTGSSGSKTDRAVASANGRFFANSAWTSASSSGKLKSLSQSAGSQASAGFDSLAVSQVDISGVKPSVPYAAAACSVVSPFVVYSSAEMSGSYPGTAGVASSPA